MASLNIRKGDRVLVRTGKEKGKIGKILKTIPDKERVIVEGLNLVKRAVRPSQKNPQGGIIDREASVHVSNVMLVCQSCDLPARVAHKMSNEGRMSRVCRDCGAEIDKG